MKLNFILLVVVLISTLFTGLPAFAWGERGHHSICEVATRLVTNPDLSDYLRGRLHLMGHACNIPDIYWRDLGPVAKSGDATHFMNPENLGYTIDTVPTDLSQIKKDKEGKYSDLLKRNINVLEDLGSSWWRYDEFYRLAVNEGKMAKTLEADAATPAPKGQSTTPAKDKYSQAIFRMMTNMGLMGHFVGDASQPFHNTTDYDGWNVQHGGIHAFYETAVVAEIELALPARIYTEAMNIRNGKEGLTAGLSPLDTIREVALKTMGDRSQIIKLDPITQPSELKPNPDGTVTKIYAKRKSPAEAVSLFEGLITHEMALSALALAQAWDQIYAESDHPNFRWYNTYAYPLKPDFVAPDYADNRSPSAVPAKKSKHRKKRKQ